LNIGGNGQEIAD